MSTFLFIVWGILVFITGAMHDRDLIRHSRLIFGFILRDLVGCILCVCLVLYFLKTNYNFGGVILCLVCFLISGFWLVTKLLELCGDESEYRRWFEKKLPWFFRA